jgi:hypothetical protein
MKEIWKDIPGYEGRYQASNQGRIKSLVSNIIMKQQLGKRGYYCVDLSLNGKRKNYTVHKLVAMCFLSHEPDGTMNLVIDHINNDKLDNRIHNLQLISNRDNLIKSIDKEKTYSKYTGVTWDKQSQKWKSNIRINSKSYHLGLFEIEEDAHKAFQQKIKEMGE